MAGKKDFDVEVTDQVALKALVGHDGGDKVFVLAT